MPWSTQIANENRIPFYALAVFPSNLTSSSTSHGRTTTCSRTAGIVNSTRNLTPFASRDRALPSSSRTSKWWQSSVYGLCSIHSRYIQRDARREIKNGKTMHNHTRTGASYWSMWRMCRCPRPTGKDTVRQKNWQTVQAYETNRRSKHCLASRHLGQYVSQAGFGEHWFHGSDVSK